MSEIHLKRWDKYGGRVLGDLEIDGKYLSKLMIETGHAVEYHGEKKVN
jgi:endonuclease YncB( thermonuclease family)